jgi:cholest-4-en-3-one 26-monooxygenase
VKRLDLADPSVFLDGVPYEYFAWLRDHEPVAWHDETDTTGGTGYWVITRHDDVSTATRDWHRYSNALRGAAMEDPASEAELTARRMIFVNQDPPTHSRLRKLVSPAFTPGHVRRLQPQIEAMVTRLVDRTVDTEVVDFLRIGEELSFQLVATLFGVPEEDWPMVLGWARVITNFQEPSLNPSGASRYELQQKALAYASGLVAQARANPDGHTGIVADLVASEIVGDDGTTQRLSDAELATFFLIVVVGGVGTTSHLLTEAVAAWIEQPDIFAPWSGEPCPPAVVEELIRWRGPVMNFRRTATEDHELRGARIAAGDKVLLSFSSANRDESHFSAPTVFDPTRTPNDHVGFGAGGPHYCIGAQLARLDIRLMMSELFRRVRSFEPAGDPVRLRSNQFAGYVSYPVHAVPR